MTESVRPKKISLVPSRQPKEIEIGGYGWKIIELNVKERDEIFDKYTKVGDVQVGNPRGARKIEQDTYAMLAELVAKSVVEVPVELMVEFETAYNRKWEHTAECFRMLSTSIYNELTKTVQPLIAVGGENEDFLDKQ